jgi:hypothetical protein
MFKTGIFRDTRAGPNGGKMDVTNFLSQFTESAVVEDIDMNRERRKALMDYGPDPILFEEDMPRLNNFSKERLNLRHFGAYDPTGPWKNDEYDLQHHDKDPRGWLGETDWKKYHAADEPKMRQRIFHSSSDKVIASQGVSWTDVQRRLSRMRAELKGYMPWFSESLSTMGAGKTNLNYNTPSATADMVSREIDPHHYSAVDNKNVNRFNYGNLGGKYFLDRTTTDHVMPTSSYNFLFRTDTPLAPGGVNKLIRGDQKLSRLNESQSKNVMKFLFEDSGKRQTEGSQRNPERNLRARNHQILQILVNNSGKTLSEAAKYNQTLFLQNNPKMRLQMDVVSLLGLTDAEIRWMESKKNVNRAAYQECVGNLVNMLEALDGVPISKLQDERDNIMRARMQEFGGGCGDTEINIKKKRILEGRNVAGTTAVNTGQAPTEDSRRPQRNSLSNLIFGGPREKVGRLDAESNVVNKFEGLFNSNRGILQELSNKLRSVPDSQLGQNSYTVSNTNRLMDYDGRPSVEIGDSEFGTERAYDYEVKSWNDSHLIPKQFKK